MIKKEENTEKLLGLFNPVISHISNVFNYSSTAYCNINSKQNNLYSLDLS